MTEILPEGDRDEAITSLFEQHGDAVYRFGLRMCEDSGFAEDLVQETFLRAHQSWGRFEGRSQPLTWLYTIASRACSRLRRRRSGEPRRVHGLNTLLAVEADHDSSTSSVSGSPLDAVVRSDEVRRLRSAINLLPTGFRVPLVLKELEGLSVAEVSRILGLKEPTVKTRLHRARLTLRRELASAPSPSRDATLSDSTQACADLLAAKLEAMARGVPFPLASDRICETCAATLDSLDRTRELCVGFPTHPLPDPIRERVYRALQDLEGR